MSSFTLKVGFLVIVFALALRPSFAQTSSNCASLVDKAFEVTAEKQQILEMPEFAALNAENARSWGADPAVIAHMNQINHQTLC